MSIPSSFSRGFCLPLALLRREFLSFHAMLKHSNADKTILQSYHGNRNPPLSDR